MMTAVVLLWGLMSQPAEARVDTSHQVEVIVHDDAVEVRATPPVHRVPGVDDDRNGSIDVREMVKHRAEILGWFRDGLTVVAGGEAPRMTRYSVALVPSEEGRGQDVQVRLWLRWDEAVDDKRVWYHHARQGGAVLTTRTDEGETVHHVRRRHARRPVRLDKAPARS